MGLDQHRAQISAEWIDAITGEISRARVAPAERDGVRKFLARFAGQDLEVALEATTGWRFVVEELQRIGADVHLAEPAETGALKGQEEAPQDRPGRRSPPAGAAVDRPAAGVMDPAGAPARSPRPGPLPAHAASAADRMAAPMQAVLYRHGIAQRRDLLTLEKREWMAGLALPAAAREHITIALQLIDALDPQLVPFDLDLRACARKQTGGRALVDQVYGVGGLVAVTILAELGDPRRFANSRDVVRYSGLHL